MNRTLMLMATAALLAGCGGGGVPPVVVVEDRSVPAGATTSPTAYAEFVGSRPVENALEPLVVQGVLPPTSDEDEPLPLR